MPAVTGCDFHPRDYDDTEVGTRGRGRFDCLDGVVIGDRDHADSGARGPEHKSFWRPPTVARRRVQVKVDTGRRNGLVFRQGFACPQIAEYTRRQVTE